MIIHIGIIGAVIFCTFSIISIHHKINSNDCQIFDSGTSFNENGKLSTAGGRVLSIVCQDKDFDKVFEKAYKNLKEIHFEGIFFRNDIGHQVRKNFSKEN